MKKELSEEELFEKVPIFRKEHSEVKKWTVRDCTTKINPLNNNQVYDDNVNKVTNEPKIVKLFSGSTNNTDDEGVHLVSNKNLSPPIKPQPIRPNDSDIRSLLNRKVVLQSINPLYNVPIKFRAKYNEIMHLSIPTPTTA